MLSRRRFSKGVTMSKVDMLYYMRDEAVRKEKHIWLVVNLSYESFYSLMCSITEDFHRAGYAPCPPIEKRDNGDFKVIGMTFRPVVADIYTMIRKLRGSSRYYCGALINMPQDDKRLSEILALLKQFDIEPYYINEI